MLPIHFPDLRTDRAPISLAGALQGTPRTDVSGLQPRRLDSLYEEAPDLFEIVPPDQAAVWVYPYDYPGDTAAAVVADAARAAGKPIVFFKHGDDATPTHLPYGRVYRESLFRSRAGVHEHVLPALVIDPESEIPFNPRAYSTRPIIGFCGYTGRAWLGPFYRLIGRPAKADGLTLRRRLLSVFCKNPNVQCNFITRSQFWGGAIGLHARRVAMIAQKLRLVRSKPLDAEIDLVRQKQVYQDFVRNLSGSDYILCPRGTGNFSYRFYETLAAGRIPVFISTDSMLPFADRIDWPSHAVVIDLDSIETAPAQVVAYHRALSPERFAEIQMGNRRLWEKFFSAPAFYHAALLDASVATNALAAS